MLNEWNSLFAATAGAAATLTGLLFVAVSINLGKVLSTSALPKRALVSIILLLLILLFSVLVLIPRQSFVELGTRMLWLASIAWIVTLLVDFKGIRVLPSAYRKHYILNVVLDQVAIIAYLFSGASIVSRGEKGVHYLVTAIIFSFIKAIIDAWVLLVEINR